jgi:uncharacterized protein YndB with AHSA1/START domain
VDAFTHKSNEGRWLCLQKETIMQTTRKILITVENLINAPIEKVWNFWTSPEHITQWCQASDEWHVTAAENNLRAGGAFKTVMASKD